MISFFQTSKKIFEVGVDPATPTFILLNRLANFSKCSTEGTFPLEKIG